MGVHYARGARTLAPCTVMCSLRTNFRQLSVVMYPFGWPGEASHFSEVLHSEERRASDAVLGACEAWVTIVTHTIRGACDSSDHSP